jgi:hypothetical protein
MLEEEIRHLRERLGDLEGRERERVGHGNGGDVDNTDRMSIAPPPYEEI